MSRCFHPLIAAAAACVLLGGCANISQTLEGERRAMVKIPVAAEPGRGTQRAANGIAFQQVFAAPTLGGTRPATWFLAWRTDHSPLLGKGRDGLGDIADASFGAWKRYPILIEENFTFDARGRRSGKRETKTGVPAIGEPVSPLDDGRGRDVKLAKGPKVEWPYKMTKEDVADWKRRHPTEEVPDFDPLWHLGDNYTQLRSARSAARLGKGGSPIRIGHLDNGFTLGHAARPANMMEDKRSANSPGLAKAVQSGNIKGHPSPGQTRGEHGTGTLGILAGGRVTMAPTTVGGVKVGGINEAIGGAPEAQVLSVRVAPWVGSLSSAELAYGIDLASRVNGCEVITMSHGGLPTVAWADAINAAYERGTAIFAAESDFFSLVPRPFYPAAFIWPASPVWPAAFRRVVGVTGVQKDGMTYAKGGNTLNPFKCNMRGSYGPDGARNFGIFASRKADPQTVKFGGELRAHPIAAYAPNIVWPAVRKDATTGKTKLDGLEFDGAGTSSATPQVAAAAALWLQKHRTGFTPAEWNSWKRAEAVYFALLSTADRTASKGKADMYLGAGTLKASAALAVNPRAAIAAKKGQPGSTSDLYFPERIQGRNDYGMASDFCDGERSAGAFFGIKLANLGNNDPTKRKTLDEKSHASETREEAMKRITENDELIRAWRGGKLPKREKGT